MHITYYTFSYNAYKKSHRKLLFFFFTVSVMPRYLENLYEAYTF